jgi:hypothetical protein
MDGTPDLAKLTPRERLRFWADLAAREATARGEWAKSCADIEAMTLRIGAELLDVVDGQFCWRGHATELVLAEQSELAGDDLDNREAEADSREEAAEPGPWPVNVETDLLARMRTAGEDLDAALREHARVRRERSDIVLATVHSLVGGASFAILTASDPQLGIQATYVFSPQRSS